MHKLIPLRGGVNQRVEGELGLDFHIQPMLNGARIAAGHDDAQFDRRRRAVRPVFLAEQQDPAGIGELHDRIPQFIKQGHGAASSVSIRIFGTFGL